MRRHLHLALAGLAVLLAASSMALAQYKEREIKAPKDKVLDLCATGKYDSIMTEFDGLTVRFFCDPFMPPLLLGAPGSVEDKSKQKPGPAISETFPDCPPTDRAYGLCEMTRLERDLRRKMLEVEERKAFERMRAAEDWAAHEKERKNQPPPPPPCIPLKEVGVSMGMTSDILGARGYLTRILQIPNDVRLVYQIRHQALYGPMSRIQEGDLVSVDAIASRSLFAFPILPDVTLTREQAGNLCQVGMALSDLGAKPLTAVLREAGLEQKEPGKIRLRPQPADDEAESSRGPGVITLPPVDGSGPIQLVPTK